MAGDVNAQLLFLTASFQFLAVVGGMAILWFVFRHQRKFEHPSLLARLKAAFSPENRGPILRRAFVVAAILGILGVVAIFVAATLL